MRSKVLFYLVAAILVLSLVACIVTVNDGGSNTVRGSGAVVTEERDVGSLSGVELTMPGTLSITMGDGESLRVEAQENLLDYIQTEVRGGTLRIQTRPGTNLQTTRPLNYVLTVDKLDSIAVSSSGSVETGDLQATSFSVRISSSGNITIDSLDCNSLKVELSSSGNLEISGGQARRQTIAISSSGEYRGRDVVSEETEVTLTSSGTATVRVNDRLTGRLSSSGNVRYIGDPEVDIRETSSGRAVQIGE